MEAPKTVNAFVDLIEQAIFEVKDLLSSIEYDELREYDEFVPAYQTLIEQLAQLKRAVTEGGHLFADGTDLAFYELAKQNRRSMPYYTMFEALNVAHHAGVE
ncbi:MAG TPA: hypothetical protein ENI80_01825 [Acidiferrobacteraceae bacterium]|nr:hypothetical protein [Acidiferrobacteraceae bacterium]